MKRYIVAYYSTEPDQKWRWWHARKTCLLAATLLGYAPQETVRLEPKVWNDDESQCDTCGAYINWVDRVEE